MSLYFLKNWPAFFFKISLFAGLLLQVVVSVFAETRLPQRETFYLTPTIEGLFACDEGLKDHKLTKIEQVNDYCVQRKLDAAPSINRLLDQLEPGGAKGQVQLGYVATLQLLALYKRKDQNWAIDENKLDVFLQLLTHVNRPVVVYLAADHFDSMSPLADRLLEDSKNQMLLSTGIPALSTYFGTRIAPYTLQTDETIAVNFYRFSALRHVIKRLGRLPKDAQKRIIAVTLAGELHQMFPDFESGTGRYENIQVTDYSPASIAGFRKWLRAKYNNIEEFNALHGSNVASFQDIPAPFKDKFDKNTKRSLEYYDAFADGILPIAGWLWDPQQRVAQLDLYINGKKVGPVQRGFNRLDVYRAITDVTTPNVGYRVDVDFSQFESGTHLAQVVGTTSSGIYLLGSMSFTVKRTLDQAPLTSHRAELPGLKSSNDFKEIKTYLDLPKPGLTVHFNLLARDWNNYRAIQVRQFLNHLYNIAREAGLSSDKIYSHQLLPNVNSSWNPQLFSVEQTLAADVPWKIGVNLYGGATDSEWVRNFLAQRKHTGYGVPEFNPQQWKQAGIHLKALRSHYLAGAKFVSPYYLSATPDRYRLKTQLGAVNAMELRPDNTAEGSDQFYRAIRKFSEY